MADILGIKVTDDEWGYLMEQQANGKELVVENGKVVAKEHQATQEEINMQRRQELKTLLNKYKEDVEQVELFGMERADYEEKKILCANMILELRQLEKGE